MSTRATYQIGLEFGGRVTFYIHHDGYPEGAASYLHAMHKCKCNGGLADRFHKGNDQAEITSGHDAHGDTEYRYTVQKGGTLQAQKRYGDSWNTFFSGHYAEFINRYGNKEKLHKVSRRYGGATWASLGELREKVEESARALSEYAARFPQFTGNINELEKEAEHWRNQYEIVKAFADLED